jgi:plastocyanin
MAARLKPGDKVAWATSQGETHGTVERKITGTAKLRGHTAKASPDEPQFQVKSAKTGAKAIHKAKALHKC